MKAVAAHADGAQEAGATNYAEQQFRTQIVNKVFNKGMARIDTLLNAKLAEAEAAFEKVQARLGGGSWSMRGSRCPE